MVFRFLHSKKGFTLTEIFMCVAVLGILTAVAVPIFNVSLKKRRYEDSCSQAQMIQTTIQQIMYGMIDNGKKQDEIYLISKCDDDIIKDGKTTAFTTVSFPGSDDSKKEWVLFTPDITVAQIRGGYRSTGALDATDTPTYDAGCKAYNYLKKFDFAENSIKVSACFSNQEMPICPFVEDEGTYTYYFDKDGNVLCGCEKCREMRADS